MHLTCSLQIISFCCFCCHISQLKHPKLKFFKVQREEKKSIKNSLSLFSEFNFLLFLLHLWRQQFFFSISMFNNIKVNFLWLWCYAQKSMYEIGRKQKILNGHQLKLVDLLEMGTFGLGFLSFWLGSKFYLDNYSNYHGQI